MTTIQRYKKREMTKKFFNKNLPPIFYYQISLIYTIKNQNTIFKTNKKAKLAPPPKKQTPPQGEPPR